MCHHGQRTGDKLPRDCLSEDVGRIQLVYKGLAPKLLGVGQVQDRCSHRLYTRHLQERVKAVVYSNHEKVWNVDLSVCESHSS